MDRRLIGYIPPVLADYTEIRAAMEAEQRELELIHSVKNLTVQNRFAKEAPEYGIGRWERILEISPRAAETLESRRARVLFRINERLPYTKRVLRRLLDAAYGEGNVGFEVNHGLHLFSLTFLRPSGALPYAEVCQMLERVLPLDLVFELVALAADETLAIRSQTAHGYSQYPLCGTLDCGVYPDKTNIGYLIKTEAAAPSVNYGGEHQYPLAGYARASDKLYHTEAVPEGRE